MLHQPWGGTRGTAADISIQRRGDRAAQAVDLNEILAKHTGQPLDRIEEDTDREFYMGAEDAKDYGIVDEVLTGNPAK